MKKELKFQLDYLPIGAHYNNLRYLLKKDVWNHIKNEIRKEKNFQCEFCNKKFSGTYVKYLECHEYWEFDLKNKKQILSKLMCLCSWCHKTQHINFSFLINVEDKIINHFMKVNKLTISDFNELKRNNLLLRNSLIDSNKEEINKEDLNKIENWTLKIECDLKKYLPIELQKDEFITFLNNLNWRNE